MSSAAMYIAFLVVLVDTVSADCYPEPRLPAESRRERIISIHCLNGTDADTKSLDDAVETCLQHGGTLADSSSLNYIIAKYAIDFPELWVSDGKTDTKCHFWKDGSLHSTNQCSMKMRFVCSLVVDEFNWCSMLSHFQMSAKKAELLCDHFEPTAKRAPRLGEYYKPYVPDFPTDGVCHLFISKSAPPVIVDHNHNGDTLFPYVDNIIEHPFYGPPSDAKTYTPIMQCKLDAYKTDKYYEHGSLILNFHSKLVEWQTAKNICIAEGGVLMDLRSGEFIDLMTFDLKGHTDWWVGGTEGSFFKNGEFKTGNAKEQKKFICRRTSLPNTSD